MARKRKDTVAFDENTTATGGASTKSRQQDNNDSPVSKSKSVQKKRKRTRKSTHNKVPDADKGSRLLSLPAELRNKIYEFVLVEDERILLPNLTREIGNLLPDDGAVDWMNGLMRPGFLNTSKQVRDEATSIYVGSNRFQSSWNRSCGRSILTWLRAIGKDGRNALTDVSVSRTSHFAVALSGLEKIEGYLAAQRLSLPDNVIHTQYQSRPPERVEMYLNKSGLRSRMTPRDWEDYRRYS